MTGTSKKGSFWFLENIDLVNIFCPKKLGNVKQHIEKIYAKNEYIYMPNEYADKIFLITTGKVKIGSYSDEGREITKVILGSGEVFGELSLVGEKTRHDFAQAIDETYVCILSVEEMKGMLQEHSPLNLFMMRIMGSRLLKMEQKLESLVFKDSRTRIIEYLRDLTEEKGQRVGFEIVVRNFMTHQEIANITATSRQTVTTILNDLRRDNIITFNRKRMLVRDFEKLK